MISVDGMKPQTSSPALVLISRSGISLIILGKTSYAFWQSNEILQLEDPSYDEILMP